MFGYLLSYWIRSPRIETQIKTVTEYVTVDRVVEIMPVLNCPHEDLKKPATNGELLIEYKRLLDWRANCLNSIRDAKK